MILIIITFKYHDMTILLKYCPSLVHTCMKMWGFHIALCYLTLFSHHSMETEACAPGFTYTCILYTHHIPSPLPPPPPSPTPPPPLPLLHRTSSSTRTQCYSRSRAPQWRGLRAHRAQPSVSVTVAAAWGRGQRSMGRWPGDEASPPWGCGLGTRPALHGMVAWGRLGCCSVELLLLAVQGFAWIIRK